MKFLGLPWPVWGALCLVVAAVYLVVWPKPKDPALFQALPVWRYVVLRWFHGLLWLLLAASCFIRPTSALGGVGTANLLAQVAGLRYLAFLFVSATTPRS